MPVLGIASHVLDFGRIVMNIPILIQKFSLFSLNERSTDSKPLMSNILSTILKYQSKIGFTFDANISNWYQHFSEEKNIIEIEYIDLVYFNHQADIKKDISEIVNGLK